MQGPRVARTRRRGRVPELCLQEVSAGRVRAASVDVGRRFTIRAALGQERRCGARLNSEKLVRLGGDAVRDRLERTGEVGRGRCERGSRRRKKREGDRSRESGGKVHPR